MHIPDEPICIVLASDQAGLAPHATVIGSLIRHTSRKVHVRMFLRGGRVTNFEAGRLRVEFIEVDNGLCGKIPRHVTQSTFDRLLVLRDCPDWSRALILDYDQLVLMDVAPLFGMNLEGNLIAARLWHKSLGYAAKQWFGRALPPEYEKHSGGKFFYMGPLIDLAAARQVGLWETFKEVHERLKMEEQIALTIAVQDKILPLPAKWNLVPQWDKPVEPEGVIHYTGPTKPWMDSQRPYAAWWQSHETSWEQLRQGVGC